MGRDGHPPCPDAGTVSSPTDAAVGRKMLRISENALTGLCPRMRTSGWGVTRIRPRILKALASTRKHAAPARGLLLQ